MDVTSVDHLAQVQTRLMRSRLWAMTLLGVHLGVVVAVAVMIIRRGSEPARWIIVAAVVLIASALHFRWRQKVRRRPAGRLASATVVALFDAAALWIANDGLIAPYDTSIPRHHLTWPVAVVILELGSAVLASRALRTPLTPDLGVAPVDVTVKLRTGSKGQDQGQAVLHPWMSSSEVTLTDKTISVVVRPSLSWAAQLIIPLAAVHAVDTRPARPTDSPWLRKGDWTSDAPPGDLVVIHQEAEGLVVLPVFNAAEFSEIIRVRAGLIQGRLIPRQTS